MPRSVAERERWTFIRQISSLPYAQQQIEVVAHDRCPERVHSTDAWSPSHWCARPVKTEGLCGVHLGAKKRATKQTVREATSKEVDQRLERAMSRILDHPIHLSRIYGSYASFVVENAESLLAEFGVEPIHSWTEFKHKRNCPKNAIGSTHVGETCREYIARSGVVAGPDMSDLEEDE